MRCRLPEPRQNHIQAGAACRSKADLRQDKFRVPQFSGRLGHWYATVRDFVRENNSLCRAVRQSLKTRRPDLRPQVACAVHWTARGGRTYFSRTAPKRVPLHLKRGKESNHHHAPSTWLAHWTGPDSVRMPKAICRTARRHAQRKLGRPSLIRRSCHIAGRGSARPTGIRQDTRQGLRSTRIYACDDSPWNQTSITRQNARCRRSKGWAKVAR